MTTATKWAVAVGVLVLATVVALLPLREDAQQPPAAGQPGPDLTAAREAAALPGCPADAGQGTPPVSALGGVVVPCLGDGAPVDLGSALAGKATLVNVWATWCQPCREELPVLRDFAAGSNDVEVLTVQVASPALDGLRMLTELGVRLPTVHDGEGTTGPVRQALEVPQLLPASYLVTEGGDVRFIEQPRVFHSTEQVADAVARHRSGAL